MYPSHNSFLVYCSLDLICSLFSLSSSYFGNQFIYFFSSNVYTWFCFIHISFLFQNFLLLMDMMPLLMSLNILGILTLKSLWDNFIKFILSLGISCLTERSWCLCRLSSLVSSSRLFWQPHSERECDCVCVSLILFV